ncbi:hypothetical protein A2643_01505 [Candidatus Nomurabacteria bacterium RIFCSPHIGHO2_01_FULL_39_220]|uniref:Uncharacterized protein n=1 Tax=Candidatus Nomurabacteria bacterium RIFCSPLOWO2_02_FULL_40_67 TaxID=1801787 RepID=A0A1F6Y5C1_9BACT|nr:MAG: hypothetical protein UU66_C0002G0002 [Parcubacteria group bacterium GW2011_GWB1_41_5]OGI61671.1 MAG: hypothetical protein A2W12_02240 [Candidatus Nomurabacteria bacterium RBG_16_40_11]OGI69934.1 MAG: hypothetical protein A2643_01505 [Candidatus Nomurabacteria bacterium RIFCSPHIGHO2_01_FULL_39_220]OGI73405.1 MAG: hypothetical protein A2W56_00905 [Candidatus Nomurabacteria bacterium RIFCSPHIGHO2_02_41_18]OGI78506.1 MAG: hypothetical protein A3C65_02620 [Candidatus Nomurabacteria bacterium
MKEHFTQTENKSEKERLLKLTLRELYAELSVSKQPVGRLETLCSREIHDNDGTKDIKGIENFKTYGDLPINQFTKIPINYWMEMTRDVGVTTLNVLKSKLEGNGIFMAARRDIFREEYNERRKLEKIRELLSRKNTLELQIKKINEQLVKLGYSKEN